MSVVSNKIRNKMRAVGVCDRSGFVYNLSDLVKQMDYMGDTLKWTGLMVGRDQLDQPNYQNKPFKAKIEGVLPPNNRPNIIPGIPEFYGPTLSTQEVLEQLRRGG